MVTVFTLWTYIFYFNLKTVVTFSLSYSYFDNCVAKSDFLRNSDTFVWQNSCQNRNKKPLIYVFGLDCIYESKNSSQSN